MDGGAPATPRSRSATNLHQIVFACTLRALLFALCCYSTSVRATEIIVNQRHPRASDRNAGTKQKPLKTISAAAARVKAGDHVVIHGGDYRETVIIKASGRPEEPIVFEAAPGETPVIKGSDVISGWTRKSPNIWKAKLSPVPPRSDKSDDPTYWRTNDIRQVFLWDPLESTCRHASLSIL